MTDVRDLADARAARAVRERIETTLGEAGIWMHAAVRDGVVTLTGPVPTERARLAAVTACRRTPGVRTVHDALDPASDAGFTGSDLDLAIAVEDLLYGLDPVFQGLAVDVREGTVLLTGTLDRHAQRAAAVRVARTVPGVRGVLSGIVLRTHPSARRVRPLG